MSGSGISLSEALRISIDRIIGRYGTSWVITGNTGEKSLEVREMYFPFNECFDEATGPENHSYTEICICFEGSLAMLMGEQILDLEQADVCFILPGVRHCEMSKKDSSYMAVWISISHNTVALHLSGKNSGNGVFYTIMGCTLDAGFDYNPAVSSIRDEIAGSLAFSQELVKTHIIQILTSIYRRIGGFAGIASENKSWKELVVMQVQKYVEMNCSRPIRLSDLSQELCISPNYLNNIFKSMTGQTIIRYAEGFKIKEAMLLLRSTAWSIGKIADRLGYYDQYHFSKIFKKETGCTPTQYRKSG